LTVTPQARKERGSFPLNVALLTAELAAGPAFYPAAPAGDRGALARLPVRPRAAGATRARVTVRYELCDDGGRCQPPERVTLETELVVKARR
jgi:hypothetical protein